MQSELKHGHYQGFIPALRAIHIRRRPEPLHGSMGIQSIISASQQQRHSPGLPLSTVLSHLRMFLRLEYRFSGD